MSVSMVREPSAEPNISNIDDIIGLRYAYGNQNGYVLDKGNEISNTVNGSTITINSGRLVINGVECDIDANGVAITVDNVATKRYYTVYLQVNLNTNTASILSSYATGDYPTVSTGDDLTANPTGTARMVLYHFTAQSGAISDVTKIVPSIKYTKDIKVTDADYADYSGEATYARSAGSANNAYKYTISVTGTVGLYKSDFTSLDSRSVTFSGNGLRIGNFWYGNLFFQASSSMSGSFSNCNLARLTITSSNVSSIYTVGMMTVKQALNDNGVVLVDRYGQGYSSDTPKIADYKGTGNFTMNYGNYCVIAIIGIMLELS